MAMQDNQEDAPILRTDMMNSFQRVKYKKEDTGLQAVVISLLGGFIIAVIWVIGLIMGLSEGKYLIIAGTFIGFCVILFGIFMKRRAPAAQFKRERAMMKAKGVMYFGTVTGLNMVVAQTHHVVEALDYMMNQKQRDLTAYDYSYYVSYTDTWQVEKNFETEPLYTYNQKHIGRRCIVYEFEDRVILDAIEREGGDDGKLKAAYILIGIAGAMFLAGLIGMILGSRVMGIIGVAGVLIGAVGAGLWQQFRK